MDGPNKEVVPTDPSSLPQGGPHPPQVELPKEDPPQGDPPQEEPPQGDLPQGGSVATQEKPLQEKEVVFDDNVQVYTIVKDSVLVRLEPSPPKMLFSPSDEVLHRFDTNINEIIVETIDALDTYLKQVLEMRSNAQKRLFMLTRIQQSVETYKDHVEKLKNFFFHNEQIQSKWYAGFCSVLPPYGDYQKGFKDSEDVVRLKGIPHPVPQNDVKKLLEDVVNTVFAGGTFVNSQRAMCKTIDYVKRTKLSDEYLDPLEQNSAFIKKLCDGQQKIMDMLFCLQAHVNFLRVDRLEPIPNLDLTKYFE